MPTTPTTLRAPDDFPRRARELASGLWRAVRETPARLARVYRQPAARGGSGMKAVENTAGEGARGLRRLGESIEQLNRPR